MLVLLLLDTSGFSLSQVSFREKNTAYSVPVVFFLLLMAILDVILCGIDVFCDWRRR